MTVAAGELRLTPLPPAEEAERITADGAVRVFGRLLGRQRGNEGLLLGRVAADSGYTPYELSRIERGLEKPPQGDSLLALMKALRLQMESVEAVEFVAAAALARLDPHLLQAISDRLAPK